MVITFLGSVKEQHDYSLASSSPSLADQRVDRWWCLRLQRWMGILVITVDLECCRCRAKITKVLYSLKEEFCIEKVEFEDKKEKKVVVVRGKFNAEKLCKKIWRKAGNKVIKEIIIVDKWPPPAPKLPPPPPPKPCEPCCCEHYKPKPKPEEQKPKPEEKPEQPEAKTQVKFVPFPYPMQPGMCQSWPWQCPPNQPCQCCEKPPQPPLPPPSPPLCSCSTYGGCAICGQIPPPVWPVWPQHPPVWPPTWAGCNVVADENSRAGCNVVADENSWAGCNVIADENSCAVM